MTAGDLQTCSERCQAEAVSPQAMQAADPEVNIHAEDQLCLLEDIIRLRTVRTVEHIEDLVLLSVKNQRHRLQAYHGVQINLDQDESDIQFIKDVVDIIGDRIVTEICSQHQCEATKTVKYGLDSRQGHQNTAWYNLHFLFSW